jgi:hypothetical protein
MELVSWERNVREKRDGVKGIEERNNKGEGSVLT